MPSMSELHSLPAGDHVICRECGRKIKITVNGLIAHHGPAKK